LPARNLSNTVASSGEDVLGFETGTTTDDTEWETASDFRKGIDLSANRVSNSPFIRAAALSFSNGEEGVTSDIVTLFVVL